MCHLKLVSPKNFIKLKIIPWESTTTWCPDNLQLSCEHVSMSFCKHAEIILLIFWNSFCWRWKIFFLSWHSLWWVQCHGDILGWGSIMVAHIGELFDGLASAGIGVGWNDIFVSASPVTCCCFLCDHFLLDRASLKPVWYYNLRVVGSCSYHDTHQPTKYFNGMSQ